MTSKRAWAIAAGLVVAASAVLELFFPNLAHAEFIWHRIPGFDFVYGLAGCAFIVIASKWVGHLFIQRPEGYYEKEERAE